MKNKINCFLMILLFIGNMIFLNAQSQRQITGRVMDQNGELLIGVSVLEIGTTNGTITDVNGTYNIFVSTSNPVLKFTYVGFKEKEIKVGNEGIIDISLDEDTEALDEVVVIGY
ncbi:MAG TPA: SusC/RagA family protein, partial [Porphyromonadaceae bacterium]|nr:SusC/RagA family protein [Porphyromonadaceae bacterium]